MPACEPLSIQIPAPPDHFHYTFSQTMIGDANNDGDPDPYATTFVGGLFSSRASAEVPGLRARQAALRWPSLRAVTSPSSVRSAQWDTVRICEPSQRA